MSALKSEGSQGAPRENRASQLDQPAGKIYPPFSEKLSVDEDLTLSKKEFKKTIDDFYKDKNLTPLSQLTATPAFPTPHVLAQFASKAYTDYEKQETDAQYETRLVLPEGWKLLTTASNPSLTNGYFGAACWHPEHQQVVIAHRGTANLGTLWTDVKGVMLNQYVSQMGSASTFAHMVVEVLREVYEENGVSFQLFFTGHSLGGWLAQVTTFSTEYLKREGYYFQRNNNEQNCSYPHTVVFDSPGCKDMLLQMRDTFDVPYDGRSIDIEHLDITSYLSAPNRINTCKKHAGTVYRIFPDLSDMGWWERNTAFYSLATHSMNKIVKAFDPATGQVYKDEQGQLKVQVVVDWPISAGLSDEEYNNFFKNAEYLNYYHPHSNEEIFWLKGYHPLRYQTKTYDERVSNLRVFCQQEQLFLERYRWLRQLPEFFKPKELFSVMKNEEAKEQAEKNLQTFEFENQTVRCTDASTLQALIPYVKRLLQLFPQVKENTKSALSSDEIRNRVYQIGTRRCIEQINKSPLDFKCDALSFRDFVKDEQQQVLLLNIVDADEWTGLMMAYQVLKKAGCLSEGQYTVLKLKLLLTVNQLMDFSKLMQSTVTPYLLLMECDTNQLLIAEAQDMIRSLFNAIKQKPSIKVILSTRSDGTALLSLQQIGREIFGKAFVARDKQLTWSDITKPSQEKLLEKSVKFQDAEISLSELMSAETPAANFLPLVALLEEKQLTVADPVSIPNAYNEDNYIGRTLCRQQAIKEDIKWDICRNKIPDLLIRTEEEFRQVCRNNPKENVHLLQEDKSGKLLWQQSQGSLEKLREYIDTDSSHRYTADDLDNLLKQAQHHRVMLISDTAGTGKSTVLTHLSKQIKQKFPAKWVVRIDLNDHTDELNALKQEQIDKEKAIEFVSEKLLKLKPGLETELFKQCFEQKQKVRTVIMLDGVDEISPSYKDSVIDLLQALRQTAVEQLWLTTRPHLREELEDKLQQLSYTLQPFSEQNKVEFLRKFWSLKDWFTVVGNTVEEGKSKLEIYAKELCKKVGQSISDKDKDFTGIPLQCRMLAESFDEEVKTFYLSQDSVSDVTFKLDLLDVYEKFIERKYYIYQEEKKKAQMNNVIEIEQRGRDLKTMRKYHHLPALKVLFNEEQVESFEIDGDCTFSDEELTRMGIAELKDEGKISFIHRTFAEFFVADFFVTKLNKGKKASVGAQNCLFKDIFLKADYRLVRAFIDGFLSRSWPSEEVLKQYGNRMRDVWEDTVRIMYHAAVEDNANIIGFLLESLQKAEQKDTFVQLLETQYKGRQTAWHVAAMEGNLKVLQKLWEWAKNSLLTEEIHRKYLLAGNSKGKTAWHVAAEKGKLEVLRQLWEWARAEKLNDKFLLARDVSERTFLHVAAESVNTKEFEKLWDWATENLTEKELEESLLAKDHADLTVFNVAANRPEKEVFQKLWKYATAKLSPEDIQILFTYRR